MQPMPFGPAVNRNELPRRWVHLLKLGACLFFAVLAGVYAAEEHYSSVHARRSESCDAVDMQMEQIRSAVDNYERKRHELEIMLADLTRSAADPSAAKIDLLEHWLESIDRQHEEVSEQLRSERRRVEALPHGDNLQGL